MGGATDQLLTDRIEKITGSPLLLTATEKDRHAVQILNDALLSVHNLRCAAGWRKITMTELIDSRIYQRANNQLQEAMKYVVEIQIDPPGRLDANGEPVVNGLYQLDGGQR